MTLNEYQATLEKVTAEFLETGKGEFIVQALVAQLFGQIVGTLGRANPQALGSLLLNFHRGVEATAIIAEVGVRPAPDATAPKPDPKTLN